MQLTIDLDKDNYRDVAVLMEDITQFMLRKEINYNKDSLLHKFRNLIKSLEKKNGKPVAFKEIADTADKELNLSAEAVKEEIILLKKMGEIFEPERGKYSVI